MRHSIGEQFVAKILRENEIIFQYDQPLDNLKGVRNGTLKFDIIIQKGENTVVIEYNGIYHYHIVQGKTSMFTLSKQQMNDIRLSSTTNPWPFLQFSSS